MNYSHRAVGYKKLFQDYSSSWWWVGDSVRLIFLAISECCINKSSSGVITSFSSNIQIRNFYHWRFNKFSYLHSCTYRERIVHFSPQILKLMDWISSHPLSSQRSSLGISSRGHTSHTRVDFFLGISGLFRLFKDLWNTYDKNTKRLSLHSNFKNPDTSIFDILWS